MYCRSPVYLFPSGTVSSFPHIIIIIIIIIIISSSSSSRKQMDVCKLFILCRNIDIEIYYMEVQILIGNT